MRFVPPSGQGLRRGGTGRCGRAMTYAVKELFLTLQGEGVQSGARAVFARFAACNAWSAREIDRAEAQCRFCDPHSVGTDGQGGGKFADAEALAGSVEHTWGA